MPRYDYLCPANGRVVEATHRMSERLATWGDLCRATGIDPGETPLDAEVTREWVLPTILSDRLGVDGARHAAGCACCVGDGGGGAGGRRGPIDFGKV